MRRPTWGAVRLLPTSSARCMLERKREKVRKGSLRVSTQGTPEAHSDSEHSGWPHPTAWLSVAFSLIVTEVVKSGPDLHRMIQRWFAHGMFGTINEPSGQHKSITFNSR